MLNYRAIEKLLYNYNHLVTHNKIREKALEDTIDPETGVRSPILDSIPNNNNEISRVVENIAIKQAESKKTIKKQYEETRQVLEMIDLAIEALPELERDIIKARYIDNKSWYHIANELHISDSTARRRRRKAIKDILTALNNAESEIRKVLNVL